MGEPIEPTDHAVFHGPGMDPDAEYPIPDDVAKMGFFHPRIPKLPDESFLKYYHRLEAMKDAPRIYYVDSGRRDAAGRRVFVPEA